MAQSTIPSPSTAVRESRSATVATVWRDLNRVGLQVGTAVGFGVAAVYLVIFLAIGTPDFLISCGFGVIIGVSGLIGLRRTRGDMEILLVTASLAAITSASVTSATNRGGLWAAIAIIGTVGVLLLPEHKQRRFVAFIGLLLAGQLLWPVLGWAPLTDALRNFVVSTASTIAGIAIIRMAKQALDRSERIRLKMFRSVPVGLFRCAPSGVIIDANPALAAMLGYDSPDDLVGHQVAALHDDPDEWHILSTQLEQSPDPERFAHRMVRSDGETLWIRGFAHAVSGDDGGLIYLEGSIEDVTQRREVEESARLHADRFRNVFERAPIAIWEEDFSRVGTRLAELRRRGVTDLRGYLDTHPDEVTRLIQMIGFTDVNLAGIQLLGASSKEEALTGLDPDTMPEDVAAGFVDEFVAVWEDRDTVTIEIRGATMDGGGTDLALSWAVGRTADGELDLSRVIVAIQDIAMIRQAERDLAALVESKDDLVASVSHELRTPITTILGMAFELRDHAAHFTIDETRELISVIADQSRELSNIVDDLLVAARSDRATLAVRPEVVNVTAELKRIVPADPSGPRVELERPILVWADPLRLRQVLRNLLANAGKYGGPEVTITADTYARRVHVMVRDNGIGIPVEDRDRIFDPYFRSHGDKALPGSLGLGLPVSRRLARLMGGDLTYRYDEGSVFELTLSAPIRGHFQ